MWGLLETNDVEVVDEIPEIFISPLNIEKEQDGVDAIIPVSYTHLRDQETREDLV